MLKKILIIGANSEISFEFIRLLNQENNFYFILSSRNLSNLEKNYIFLKQKKLLKLDLTQANTFKNFMSKVDKDIDLVISFAGYKETIELNHLKIFKSNYLGLKLLIKSFIDRNLFSKLKVIACVTSFLSERKNFNSSSYSLSKYHLSKYLEKIQNKQIKNLIIKDFKLGIVNTRMNKSSKFYKLISSNKVDVASILIKKFYNNQNVIYVPYFWNIILKVYNLLPKKIIFYIDDMYKKISF